MAGVFITPTLILLYLGESSSVDPIPIIIKLSLRVLVPVVIG